MNFQKQFKTLLLRALGLVVISLALIFTSTTHAAQLVNSLPAKLEKNWFVCMQYNDQQSDCQSQDLPFEIKPQDDSLKYQTFSKDFIISSAVRQTTLAIWIQSLDDVDEIYINNQLIGKTGHFLPDFESGFRYQRLYVIPNEVLLFNQTNRLRIKTFSSRNLPGIYSYSPLIGDYLKIQHEIQRQDYSFIIAATILLLLTVFQTFYFIVVRDNYETLYCAAFLIGFAFISLARSQIPLDLALDLSTAYKLESFMLNVSIISITLFLFKFFELKIQPSHVMALFVLGISAIVTIVWPYNINLRQIAELNYCLIIIISFLVIGNSLYLAIRNQRKYAWIISATVITTWFLFIYDSLMHSGRLFQIELKMHQHIVPLFSALAGTIFSLILTHKYWLFFKGATFDHLTGTLLRPAFFQRLSEEMQRCQRDQNQLMVAVIDIQQAKKLSVNYGYDNSNELLSTVSRSLTKVLRPFDLISRFSDEQFCIAASIESRKDAEACLKRVYEQLIGLQHPINQDIELYVDARVGGVIYTQEQHLSVSQLLQDANYAVSRAKSQSRHNYLLIQNPAMGA